MSDAKDSDEMSFSAYGHLKKEVAEKQKQKKIQSANAGTPMVAKVFALSMIIFVGLLASGALTGDGPFSFGNQGGDDPIVINPPEKELLDYCLNEETHGGIGTHVHYYLTILIDGQSQIIPGRTGISDNCMKPVHTHDTSGKVHVELPVDYNGGLPGVEALFQVWGETFTTTSVLGVQGDMSMTVNGANVAVDPGYVPAEEASVTISVTTS